MSGVKRGAEERDWVMHMEVPPPAAAVVVSLCIHAARGSIQDGDPIGRAVRSKGSCLARRFPKIPMKLLCLWLQGESQCAALPPTQSHAFISSKERPYASFFLPPLPIQQPIKLSLIIPMDTAIWSALNLPLMCFTVPPRQHRVWFNRSELNPGWDDRGT